MITFLIGFFTIALVLLCLFVILIVLMQRSSANGGMGSALGSGATESALGVESGNILTKWTIYGTVAFFVISFGLYLAYMARMDHHLELKKAALPSIEEVQSKDNYTPGSLTTLPNE